MPSVPESTGMPITPRWPARTTAGVTRTERLSTIYSITVTVSPATHGHHTNTGLSVGPCSTLSSLCAIF
ncbi:hypothetical protein A1O1_00073 [Capronia coronata CBS 617.96]|uniref:Uncharacterized protein n=1 Tax=Capronia coronata CBS 617.96 TaxID=1182541 RepID=W9YZ56_9EURO|nr:uncharacterized protein A1O1_00073 [Capronia coronata CBS 617.96]EXJ94955.1 hypothetical protein A1O1_00073 [Capronia coronata CBS 617.96]